MVDLHTHSRASDGSLSPGELLRTAARRGLSALALTDHDTILGLDEARREAEQLGIRLIPGIEIEITWDSPKLPTPPGEFHLLGLGLYEPSPAFLETVASLARIREARNREILDRLGEIGVKADYRELQEIAGGSVGRPHIAALLVKRGVVKNREQAFLQYLGKGRPYFVPKTGLDFQKAVAIIRESGGIAVLAHPMSLYLSWSRLPQFIEELAALGLDGIEAWHPTAKVRACKRLEELGKSLGLRITAGSDFHGESRPDRMLGITAGGREIDESYLEALPPWTEDRV